MSALPTVTPYSSWTVDGTGAGPAEFTCPLSDLPLHTGARVTGLHATGDAAGVELNLRLAELGFLPGEPVRVIARAAFGGPLAVRIGSATFALRREEARAVRVHAGQ